VNEHDELVAMADDEAEDTFDSITDLDNISDTTVLAITFLLSAQVSLSTLVLQSETMVTGGVQWLFVALGITAMALIFLSLNAIVNSLLPVGFYSEGVGEPLLSHPWLPWYGTSAEQYDSVMKMRDGGHDDLDQSTYESFVADFVADYGSADRVEDYDEFRLAKLYHYKQVGKRKAQYAGRGLAWLRLAVLLFLIQFIVAFIGVILL